MKKIRNYPQFTHFACLPFTTPSQRQQVSNIQTMTRTIVDQHYPNISFTQSNYNLAHVTLSMLILHRQDTRKMFKEVFESIKEQLFNILRDTVLTFSQVKHFVKFNHKINKSEVTLIYLQIQKNQEFKKLVKAEDLFIRAMLKSQIIINNELKQMRIHYDHNENLYKNEEHHLTLFRVKDVAEDQKFKQIFKEISMSFKPLTFKCPSVDISTRGHYQQSGFYVPLYRIQLEKHQ